MVSQKRKYVAIGLAIGVYIALLWSGNANAQGRVTQNWGGDLNSLMNGFRAIMSASVLFVPFFVLAYYTWKMKPRDVYEAAWLAIGWCALAYIIR